MPSLFVIKGNDQGTRFELEETMLGLGRDSANAIQVHDSEVSRRHAELRRVGEMFILTDLGSSNGTFVNSQRIQTHELTSGDQVQIGVTVMLYTGPSAQTDDELAEQIDIVAAGGDQSRIVRAMSPEEGSAVFAVDGGPSPSPWLARARSNLQVMYRTALAVSHTLDIDQLLARILDLIFEWVEAERGCIMLVDPDTKELTPKVRRTRRGSQGDERITISQTILDYVRQRNEGVLTSNAREDQRWDPARSIYQAGVLEAICVPMQGRYDVVGVIYIDTTTPADRMLQQGGVANRFHDEHLKLMIAIGHQAALAVEDTSYYSAMVQAERLAAVGQTIAMLSHHTKNILQGINGGAYLIDEGLKSHEEDIVRKGWDIVQKNQQKISNLVMDMLTFSKERDPDLVPADLNQVAADVIELMQGRACDLDVQLHWKPGANVPILKFDPDGLHRAILNIITNAIDACDLAENARVDVSTEFDEAASVVRVIVQDNGAGIVPEDVGKMFSLFVSRKGGRGTGLGLPVTQKIIKEHGGEVLVQSELGKGSRFTLELPAVHVEAEPPEPESIRDTKPDD